MIHSGRLRGPRALAIGLGATLLSLTLAACGDGADEPGVATAGGATASSSPAGGGVVAEYVESQRQWVKCLREQGFDLPDPDAKGRVDLRAPGAPKKTDPKWSAAQNACAKYNLPVPEGVEDKPVLTAEEIAHKRAFAKCMRENGVADFPDPLPDGQMPGRSNQPVSEQQATAELRASQICQPVLDGNPPTTPGPLPTFRG